MLIPISCVFIGWALGVASMWGLVARYERRIRNLEEALKYQHEWGKWRDLEFTRVRTRWANWRRKHRRLGCR